MQNDNFRFSFTVPEKHVGAILRIVHDFKAANLDVSPVEEKAPDTRVKVSAIILELVPMKTTVSLSNLREELAKRGLRPSQISMSLVQLRKHKQVKIDKAKDKITRIK